MYSNHTSAEKHLVGWREWVSLPELGIQWIKAKVDTGARTSALHAFDLESFTKDDKLWVRFQIHPIQHHQEVVLECCTLVNDQRLVSDSGGHRERRFVIVTPLCLGDLTWPIEITLTARDTMRFRMLLGRTAMAGRLLVDSQASYLFGKPPSTLKL